MELPSHRYAVDLCGKPIRDPATGGTDLANYYEDDPWQSQIPSLQKQAEWVERWNQVENVKFARANRTKVVEDILNISHDKQNVYGLTVDHQVHEYLQEY